MKTSLIIDCHGHYTTAPKALENWRNQQIAGIADPALMPKVSDLKISDDELRDALDRLQALLDATRPVLAKHGLAFTALPGGGQLVGMLLHESGQTLTGSLPISGGTPQALGSSITYGRRYLLGCMTGLVTDDDDDGQVAAAEPKVPPLPTTLKAASWMRCWRAAG